jgi:hypothetical protein
MKEEEDNQEWYDLNDYQQLRDKPKAFFNFCMYFLPVVTGRIDFRLDRVRQKISEIATVSDEAFALLILENNWTKWKEQAYVHYKEVMDDDITLSKDMELEPQLKEAADKRGTIREKAEQNGTAGTTRVKAELKRWKYLNQSIWTDGKKTGYKFEGWSVEGMTRFNELTAKVAEDRRQPCATETEEKMKKLWEQASTVGNTKWKKRKRYHEGEEELENTPMEYQLPADTLEFLATFNKSDQGRIIEETSVSVGV